MSRVGTLASDNILLSQLLSVQKRLKDLNTQVNTEKKSQVYGGIAHDSFNLVSLENQHDLMTRFIDTNKVQQTKLEIMSTSLQTVQSTLSTFRSELGDFLAKGADDPAALSLIQDLAWTHLSEIQSVLNEKMNGQYIFSGGKSNTKPVHIPWDNLADFQATYKQATVSDSTGILTFNNATDTITAANAGAFSGFSAGDTITISGTASNDGTYTIASIDATKTTLTLSTTLVANEAPATGVTIQPQTQFPTTRAGNIALGANYYYQGDNMQIQHRVDENQTFILGINANDPAIEKGIRALLMMAQGNMSQVDTSNSTLVPNVITLVNDSIQHDAASSEMDSDMLTMQYKIETNVTSIKRAIERQTTFKATSEARLSDLENVDKTQAVALLTSQQTALEVSYTAFGRIRQLSLSDYI
jgi:flagellin-like hook-associated protein FlgL